MWMIWKHWRCPGHSLETAELYHLHASRGARLESSMCCKSGLTPSHLPNVAYSSHQEVFRAPCQFTAQSCPLSSNLSPWLIPNLPLFSDACSLADVKADGSAAPLSKGLASQEQQPHPRLALQVLRVKALVVLP